jgi:hypothetical protein
MIEINHFIPFLIFLCKVFWQKRMKILRSVVVVLLLLNSTGALFGGWNLMTHPAGDAMGLPLSYLAFSPFSDYFFPGLILFVGNGIFSAIVLAAFYLDYRFAARLITAQGAALVGWIVIQMLMIRVIFYLQFVFVGVGLALIFCGLGMARAQKRAEAESFPG